MSSPGGPTGAVRHRSVLPCDRASAGAARGIVRDLVTESGHPEWQDAAELAVTEMVANAVLHAHTPVQLLVVIERDCIRVEVRDESPVLPMQRGYSEQATTGAG